MPDEPVQLLPLDQQRALLAACKGKGFAEQRDNAFIRLFLDTGMRLHEMVGLVCDLDDEHDVAANRVAQRPLSST